MISYNCSISQDKLFEVSNQLVADFDILFNDKNVSLNLRDMLQLYTIQDSILILNTMELILAQDTSSENKDRLDRINKIKRNIYDYLYQSNEHVIPELKINPKESNTSLITVTRSREFNGKTILIEESIVSPEISSYISKLLKRTLTKLTVINLEREVPVMVGNDKTLTDALEDWKGSLYSDLKQFILRDRTLDDIEIDASMEEEAEYNKNLLITAWNLLKNQLSSNGKLIASLDSIGLQTSINPLIALVVLNNFDSVVEAFCGKSIVIDSNLKHKALIYGNKYSFHKQSIQNSSYEGSFSDASFKRILSNTLQRIFETIPDGNGGYCTTLDLNAISKHIQAIMQMNPTLFTGVIDSNGRTVGIDENFKKLFDLTSTPHTRAQALLNILTGSDDVICDIDPIKANPGKESYKTGKIFLTKYAQPAKLQSIAESFVKIFQAFENSVSGTKYLDDVKDLHTNSNILELLVNMVVTAQNMAYFRVTDRGDLKFDVNSFSAVNLNKSLLLSKLKDAVWKHIYLAKPLGGYPMIFDTRYVIEGSNSISLTYNDIFNPKFIKHIKELTGIDLDTPVVQLYLQEHPIEGANIIGKFLHTYKSLVRKTFYGKTFDNENTFNEALKQMMEQLVSTSEYVEFTDVLSLENHLDDSMMYDQLGHAQATQGAPTLVGKYILNIDTWKTERAKITTDIEDENIFIKHPEVRSEAPGAKHGRALLNDVYVFRLDTLFGDSKNKRVVSNHELKAMELTTQSFNYEFLEPMIKSGILFALLDCVSDKIRTPLGTFNANAKIKVPGTKSTYKEIKDFTIDELFELYYRLHASYYKVIEQKLIQDYRKIFALLGIVDGVSTLDDCIKILEGLTEYDYTDDNGLYHKGIKTAVKEIFANGGYVEWKPEIHFSGNKNGNLRFNNTLYYHIKAANDVNLFKRIVKSGIEETKNAFAKYDIPFLLNDITAELLNNFLQLDDIKSCADYLKANKSKKNSKVVNEFSDISDRLIAKYVIVQNMVAEGDLLLTGKMEFIHKPKGAKFQSAAEMQLSINDALGIQLEGLLDSTVNMADLDTALFDFHFDQSLRAVVSKKRYNTLVATSDPVSTGGVFQVARTQRVAHVSPHVMKLFNFNGDPENNLATNDGAILGNGIFDVIEAWSYPSKTYGIGSQKIIGIIPGFETITLVKTAKYSINNERIRNSFNTEDMLHPNRYNLYNLFGKLNSVKLSDTFGDDWRADAQHVLTKQQLWCNFNGVDARFTLDSDSIVTIDGITYISPNWITRTGEAVNLNEVAECLNLEVTPYGLKIETLFDLWKMFGAQDSSTINEVTGELVPSELSMELSALVVCKYSPNVKETMIAKVLDTESVKSGQCNVNTVDDVADPNTQLMYLVVESRRWGIQLDYTHEMIHSDIPLLTLALAGLSLNGNNILDALEVYQDLADIVDDSTLALDQYFNGDAIAKRKFKNRLVVELKRSLATSSVASTADDIVNETILHIKAWELEVRTNKDAVCKSLPFSDRNIFSKLTADMIVALNKSGIRLRFEGIAVIQNPSNGIIGVYEDRTGEVWNRQALIELANKYPQIKGSHDSRILQILQGQTGIPEIDSLFGKDEITIQNYGKITIGDVVRIQKVDLEGQPVFAEDGSVIYGAAKIINSPTELWELEHLLTTTSLKVVIDRSIKRDLRARLVYFQENGNIETLWKLRSTKFRLLTSGSNKSITATDLYKYDKDAFDELYDYELDLNEDGSLKYDKKNEIVFKKLNFKISDTLSLAYMRANYQGLAQENAYYYKTFNDFKYKRKTYVSNVQAIAGELIIPNVNKVKQGINHSLHHVKNAIRVLEFGDGHTETHHTYFEDVIKRRILKVNTLFDGETFKEGEYKVTLTTNNSEIVITNKDIDNSIKVEPIEVNGEYWLPDELGNPLFKVKLGTYKINTSKLNNGKTLYAILITESNLEENKKLARYLINSVRDVNLYYNDVNFKSVLSNNRINGVSIDPSKETLCDWDNLKGKEPKLSNLDKAIREEAEAMYNSFIVSLNTISTRIPSQSWQSFLATKTVAFTENDSNDGYMNIWEMWMQGSDFDIKQYWCR